MPSAHRFCESLTETPKIPERSLGIILQTFSLHYHESWIFPAGVCFALKQNMYWDGFCAFLPDISGLWGGGGPKPCKNQQIWGGRGGEGVFPVFTLLGNP